MDGILKKQTDELFFYGEFGIEARRFQPQFGQSFNEREINPRGLENDLDWKTREVVLNKTHKEAGVQKETKI